MNVVPDANLANPGLGIGNGVTQDQAVSTALPSINRPYNPQGDVAEQQRYAADDIASILSGDPRSALGIAARNARVDAGSYASRIGDRSNSARTVGDPNTAVEPLIAAALGGAKANTGAAIETAQQDNSNYRADGRNAVDLLQQVGIL